MRGLRGFIDYGIDTVVKFGGSLLRDADVARQAVGSFAQCLEAGHRLLIIPGGGPTDKTIEALDRRHPFAADTHHRACARAQDQTGLMICDPVFGNALVACETLEEVRSCLGRGRLPVLLPSRLIFDLDPFERSWEITSDAMASWFAWLVGARRVIILTDVDGVYPPTQGAFTGPPLPEVTASQLAAWGHTSVDACTAPFLLRHGLEGWVLNGSQPGRFIAVLAGQQTIGTYIRPE